MPAVEPFASWTKLEARAIVVFVPHKALFLSFFSISFLLSCFLSNIYPSLSPAHTTAQYS